MCDAAATLELDQSATHTPRTSLRVLFQNLIRNLSVKQGSLHPIRKAKEEEEIRTTQDTNNTKNLKGEGKQQAKTTRPKPKKICLRPLHMIAIVRLSKLNERIQT